MNRREQWERNNGGPASRWWVVVVIVISVCWPRWWRRASLRWRTGARERGRRRSRISSSLTQYKLEFKKFPTSSRA